MVDSLFLFEKLANSDRQVKLYMFFPPDIKPP